MISHRPRFAFSALLGLLGAGTLACFAAPAAAQTAQPIPNSIKKTANIGPFAKQIGDLVHGNVQRLADKNPDVQKGARQVLIADATAAGGGETPTYQDAYATALNKELSSLANNPSMRVRLNAAIVAAQVAAKVPNINLAPAARLFMKDKDEAVALWGVKAAKALVVAAAQGGSPANVERDVVGAARKYTDSAPVIEEAYGTLTLQNATLKGAEFSAAAKSVAPSLLDLLAFRTEQFTKGVPASCLSEREAALFLSTQGWRDLTAAQRTRAVQLLVEIACSGMKMIAEPADGVNVEELVALVKHIGKNLVVVGTATANPKLVEAGNACAAISSGSNPTALTATCDALRDAAKAGPGGTAPSGAVDSVTDTSK